MKSNGTHPKLHHSEHTHTQKQTCDRGTLCLVPDSLGSKWRGTFDEKKKTPQWLSAHVVVLVTALKFDYFFPSFVAISTSLENNNKIQMNWNLFSGDELFDFSVSCSLFFYPAWHFGVTKGICQCLSCAWEKAFLKTKAIVSLTTRTAANVHTECPTNPLVT